MYLTAAENRDYAELWRLMSRDAQAIMVASARAEGLSTTEGPAAVEALLKSETGSTDGLRDIAVEVIDLVGDVAEVMVGSPVAESTTLPFVLEDGEWKLGVQGLHRTTR
jgi:hypothetical protein